PEIALDGRVGWPVEEERAQHRAVDGHPSEAARVVLVGGVPAVRPLLQAILAPELRVSMVERRGDDAVVAHLVLRLRTARELRLLRSGVGRLVEQVAKRWEA